jgi:hypothetical protein
MGETWRYRYPITSFVQQALHKKVKADGAGALSDDERILFVATTFWSATARGALCAWFGSNPEGRIRDAIHALTEIGAIRMAGIVRAHAAQIARSRSEAQFDAIEELLLRSEDQVEELTARYAAPRSIEDERATRQPVSRELQD